MANNAESTSTDVFIFRSGAHKRDANGKVIMDEITGQPIPETRWRRYTVAGVVKGNALSIGVAVVSDTDQFNKALGKKIAVGRAQGRAAFCSIPLKDPSDKKAAAKEFTEFSKSLPKVAPMTIIGITRLGEENKKRVN